MKRNILVILSVILILSLSIVCLTGCDGEKVDKTDGTSVSVDNSEVVAVIDGKEVKRDEVGEALLNAEQTVIAEYLMKGVYTDFVGTLKDIVVTDEELNLQLELMKNEYGDMFELVIQSEGYATEEDFKVELKKQMIQSKYIEQKADSIEIPKEEYLKKYNDNKGSYDIVVMDAIFLETEENLSKATELKKAGKSLEDIASALSLEIMPNEHTYYQSSNITWDVDFYKAKIGDLAITKTGSGNYVIGKIKELNKGIENQKVLDNLLDEMKYEKGYDAVEKEFIEYIKARKVTIFGKEYNLYQEPEQYTTVPME